MGKISTAIHAFDNERFELCVVVQSDDGDTREDHEDYQLTRDDLQLLAQQINEHLSQ